MSATAGATDDYDIEDTIVVGPEEVFQCLQQGTPINVTAVRALVNYTLPGKAHRLVPRHKNTDHSGHVCWMRFSSPSEQSELIVDWFVQTCTPDNYVSVHAFAAHHSLHHGWEYNHWTGCEYKEDPISASYMTSVNTIYVGLHVFHTHTRYHMSFGVRAALQNTYRTEGGKDLEIRHVSLYSGNVIEHELYDDKMFTAFKHCSKVTIPTFTTGQAFYACIIAEIMWKLQLLSKQSQEFAVLVAL